MIVLKVAPTQVDIDKILSLEDAKEFIKVIGDDEDKSIQNLINSAIAEAEGLTNRQFAEATYELYLSNFPRENFRFPRNPIKEIISMEYMDLEGNYNTIEPTEYYVHKINEIGCLFFNTYPNVKIKEHKQAVRITFKCGYSKESFPADLRQYLKVKVSTLYEFREEIVSGTIISKTNHVEKILDKYKIRSI